MNFKPELTQQELNTILQGLGKLPAENSFGVIVKLHKHANEVLKEVSPQGEDKKLLQETE